MTSRKLYRHVSNAIVDNISNGTYPVGQLIPTELELSRQFKVSRHTIREAVRHVQTLGLVTRRQGQGTMVRHRHASPNMRIALRTLSDVEQHGYHTHLVGLEFRIVAADEAMAADLQSKEGDRFLHLRCLRVPIDDSMPIPPAWNQTYIVEDYAAAAEHIGTTGGPIYLLIERLYGETIEEIDQEVSSVLLDAKVAGKLAVRTRSAGLRIKRVYRGKSGKPVMIGFNTYAGDRFSVNMRFRLD